MYLDKHHPYWNNIVPVYYDLEYSGNVQINKGYHCAIWEIAAKAKDKSFHVIINPYLTRKFVPKPVHERYKMPSKHQFEKMNAVSFNEAAKLFSIFLHSFVTSADQTVLLISHNAFKGDKQVLEHELVRHRMHLCFVNLPLMFFDSLHFIRTVLPKQKSYSLGNLYESILNKKIENAHAAESDVSALQEIIETLNAPFEGVVTMLFLTPFSNIQGIGLQTEKKLLAYGYTCLEHFYCIHGIFLHNIIDALIRLNLFTDIAVLNTVALRMHHFGTKRLSV